MATEGFWVPLSLGPQRKLKAISRLEAKWTSSLPLLGPRDSVSLPIQKRLRRVLAMHPAGPHWAGPDHPLESDVPGMFEL